MKHAISTFIAYWLTADIVGLEDYVQTVVEKVETTVTNDNVVMVIVKTNNGEHRFTVKVENFDD